MLEALGMVHTGSRCFWLLFPDHAEVTVVRGGPRQRRPLRPWPWIRKCGVCAWVRAHSWKSGR